MLYTVPIQAALDELIPSGKTVAVLVSSSVQRSAGENLGLERLASRCRVISLPLIGADAPLPDVDAALSVVRRAKPDVLLGIGGGSTLDAAKTIAALGREGNLSELFRGIGHLPASRVPMVAVPTTAGSGAETSHAAILFDPATGIKGGLRNASLRAEQVVIDTSLYLHAPTQLLAECGFDALTHAIETAVSRASNSVVRWQSAAAIRVLLERLSQVVEKRCPESMEQVAIAAMHMGTNLANSSTCLPHRIQYALRARIPASHTRGLVILYRGWLELWRRQPGLTAFDELAARLGYTREGLIAQIEGLKRRLGLNYSLRDYGLEAGDLSGIAANVTGGIEQDPLYVGRETLVDILRLSL